MRFSSALVALGATLAGAVPSVKIEGNAFINEETGNRLQLVGMAYQPGGSAGFKAHSNDPLSDPEACLRDAALMQVLGVNAVRVYNLWPDQNHDECASIFNAAGIYLLIDVNGPLPGQSLTTEKPWESYYTEYLNRTFAVVEAFSNYPNTLLYFSSNEVIAQVDTAAYAPQYIRSVTRDLRNYIKNNIDRKIPVGYAAADVRDVLYDTWNYLTCVEDGDEDDMSRSDFFALNSYSWCGADATYKTSTFEELEDHLQDTAIPLFFSEFGCIEGGTRYWNSTQALYSDKMYKTLSGGVAYQWTNEDNDFGIVSVEGSTTKLLNQYSLLKDKLSEFDWESVQSVEAPKDTSDPPTCKESLIKEDGFSTNFTLIPPPPGADELIKNGIENKPKGKIVDLKSLEVTADVVDANGKKIKNLAVKKLPEDEFNWQGKATADTGSTGSGSSNSSGKDDGGDGGDGGEDGDSAASGLVQPMIWAVALPIFFMMFA